MTGLNPDGNLERLIGVPIPSPVDLEFGGEDLSTLYLTSDRHSLSKDSIVSASLSEHLLQMPGSQVGAILPVSNHSLLISSEGVVYTVKLNRVYWQG